MSSEVSYRHTDTGATLYFTIRNTAREMWNTAGTPDFETLTVANWTSYDVALSESPASSYFYVGTFPAISGNMIAGWYWVDIYEQAGGSPAISDTLVASYFGYWDGTTFNFWGVDTLQHAGQAVGLSSDNRLQVDVAEWNDVPLSTTDKLNVLYTDWLDGGRLDSILDTIAGDVVNLDGAAMRGTDGANTATPLDAVGVRAAVGLAAANLDTQLAAIPTNPMLDTEDGSSFTAIPWNSSWDAEVESEVNDALVALHLDHLFAVDYDPDSKPGTATALFNELIESNAGVSRYTAAALAQAPTGGGGDATLAKQDSIIALLGTPTDTDIATDIANVQTAVDAIDVGTGDGARTVTVTVDDGTNPLQNATVRMTEGANTYRATTDVNGQCTFNLDDATYTVAITKAGYTYAGSSLVVSGDATPSLSMTQVTITPPTGADTSTGVLECRDQFGAVEEGVNITVQISSGPGTAGYGYDTAYWTETSDASGLVQFPGLIRGATYKLWRGTRLGQGVSFVVPNSDSFNLAEVLGAS